MMISRLSSKFNFFLRNPFFPTPLYHHNHRFLTILQQKQALHHLPNGLQNGPFFKNHISVLPLRCLSINSSEEIIPERNGNDPLHYETIEDVEPIDLWEEEEEVEPEIGDGGDGGGIVFQSCSWGEQALSIARDVLLPFGDDMELYSFKTSPHGYIYVRLDKLPNNFGCPSMDEMEEFSRQYKKRLDEAGALGKIPEDLAIEVSSPGAERLIKVPDDLSRFKDRPMRVIYIEEMNSRKVEKNGIFFMESIDAESGSCVWKLAVKRKQDTSNQLSIMAVHKEVNFVAYLLIVLGMFLHVDAKACTKECGNLGFGICPRSEGSPLNPICINCCSGYKGCNYYNSFGKFICEGESDPKRPNACTFDCDPNIAYSRCPRSQGKSLIYPTGCTTCCTGYKGCYYFGKDGKFVCEGESDEPKANMYPAM